MERRKSLEGRVIVHQGHEPQVLMITSKLGGGVGYGGGIALRGLRNSYPEAYKAFQEELRG